MSVEQFIIPFIDCSSWNHRFTHRRGIINGSLSLHAYFSLTDREMDWCVHSFSSYCCVAAYLTDLGVNVASLWTQRRGSNSDLICRCKRQYPRSIILLNKAHHKSAAAAADRAVFLDTICSFISLIWSTLCRRLKWHFPETAKLLPDCSADYRPTIITPCICCA